MGHYAQELYEMSCVQTNAFMLLCEYQPRLIPSKKRCIYLSTKQEATASVKNVSG